MDSSGFGRSGVGLTGFGSFGMDEISSINLAFCAPFHFAPAIS